WRPCIENDDFPGSQTLQELVHFYRLGFAAIAKVLADETFQVGELVLGDDADGSGQLEHGRIGQSIEDEQAFLATLYQGCLPKGLEMLRRIREREIQLRRKRVDRPFSLRQELEHLKAARAGEGLADARELRVEAVLECPTSICDH